MCARCRPTRALLEVAAALRPVDADVVDDGLDAVAACALAARCAGPGDQVATLASAMDPFTACDDQIGLDDLLLDRVLRRWAGVPLVLCAVAADAGVRAGLDVVVAGDGARHVVMHRASREVVWDPVRGVRRPDGEERERLRRRCSHQVAFAALALVVERSVRGGDLETALRANELRLALPLTPSVRFRVEAERDGLLAQLN
jgi:hypothetical protein